MALSVEMTASLAEVPKGSWDALAPRDPMASHGWLKMLEEELGDGVETRYLLGWRGPELVAGLPCYLCHRIGRLLNPDQLMFGRFNRLPASLSLSFAPTLLVGSFRSYGPRFLLSESLDETARRMASQQLLSAAEDLARSRQLPIQVPKVSSDDSEALNLVTERHYHRTRDFPISYLDIEWSDFDGYLSHIRSFSVKMRRNIKEEINRFRRSGIRIVELHDVSAYDAALLELAQDHYQRLNQTAFPHSDRYFARLTELLGDEVSIYGALLEKRLIGFVLMLTRGNTAYLPMTGIDQRWTGNEGTYFNLCYYHPIMEATAKGLERIYFGATNHYPKVRRGCSILGLHHSYLGPTTLRHLSMGPWFAFHSTWMRRRVRPLENLEKLRMGGIK